MGSPPPAGAGARPPVPRRSAIAEFIANFIALLALLDAGGAHHIPLDAILANMLGSMHSMLTPAWHAAYIGAIAGTSLLAVSSIVVFIQPRLSALHEFVRALSSLIVIVGIAFTLQAGSWIEPAAGLLNTVAMYSLVSALVILSLQLTVSANILMRKPPYQSASRPQGA